MRGRFCGTKPGAEQQAAVSRLPPSPHLSPLILYQLGRRKLASLSSSQEFTSQQENESWHFASQNRDFPLSLHDGFAALLSQPVKTFAQKGLGRLSAQISTFLLPMGNRPHEGMKPPLLAQCGPFLAIQPHKLVHPPQALDFSSRPGLFFSPKGGIPRIRAAAPQKIKKGVM